MLITLLLRLRETNNARRRLARTRGDTRPPLRRHLTLVRASVPGPCNTEPGCGD